MFAISSATPAEAALDAYERYQDSQREITDDDVEGVAKYIEKLLRAGNISSKETAREAARAMEIHGEWMADELGEQMPGSDETWAAYLGRLAISDPAEAGYQLQRLSERVAADIATEFFDEFKDGAKEWGYLE